MAILPSANTTLVETAIAGTAGLTELLCIWAAVPQNADGVPRLFGSSAALLDHYGYCPGVDYAAMHIEETRKPVLFQGLPIEQAGALIDDDTSGNGGTSAVTVSVVASGAKEATNGVVRVVKGGTVGTDHIVLEVSLDGGRTFKKARVGTDNTYEIPHVGVQLAFGAGNLDVGDTIATFITSAPRWDQAGLQMARAALAAQQKQIRDVLVVGDLVTVDDADDVLTEINAFETANQRFTTARCQVRDRDPLGSDTLLDHLAAMDDAFSTIDGASARRINLAFDGGYKASPLLGYRFKRPSAWADTIRAYQHDVHVASWRKADDALPGWSLEDENGTVVLHDDYAAGGAALAARFTCLRTWGNGPEGTFVAQSLTRAGDDSALSFHHNMAVANVACSVSQRETENAIGQSVVLDADGHATAASRSVIEGRVNTALQNALLADNGEGQRASSATWSMAVDDDLRGPGATVHGVLSLDLNGTIVRIDTQARVNGA